LFDVTGQLVISQKLENATSTIEVSSLKSGIYMFRLSGNAQSKIGKIFID
jgi:hypothetical protein